MLKLVSHELHLGRVDSEVILHVRLLPGAYHKRDAEVFLLQTMLAYACKESVRKSVIIEI